MWTTTVECLAVSVGLVLQLAVAAFRAASSSHGCEHSFLSVRSSHLEDVRSLETGSRYCRVW